MNVNKDIKIGDIVYLVKPMFGFEAEHPFITSGIEKRYDESIIIYQIQDTDTSQDKDGVFYIETLYTVTEDRVTKYTTKDIVDRITQAMEKK